MSAITVLDEGRELRSTFDEMLRYNGGRSPCGVALAYKALEAVLPLLAATGRAPCDHDPLGRRRCGSGRRRARPA